MPHAPETYATRVRRLRRLMAQQRCSHLLVSDPVDCRYATGFASSNVYLLLSRGNGWLCTDFRYQTAAEAFCRAAPFWRLKIITQSDFSFVRSLLPGDGAVLGVQPEALTVQQFDRLRKVLRKTRLVKVAGVSGAVSVVKTAAEQALVARCARMADAALRRTLPALAVGVTEREVRDTLEQHCRDLGSEGPAFDTIVLFGSRSALPHGTPSNARLRTGDFVLFDFGCSHSGMRSDMTRTLVKGKASVQQQKVYRTVRTAQQQARRAVAGGVRAARIDTLARQTIEKAGYGQWFGHATGHGVGYRIHEDPRLGARSTERLAAGSVVTVEPGIYIPSLGGVRIEDMVIPTDAGCRVLTKFPRNLMEV